MKSLVYYDETNKDEPIKMYEPDSSNKVSYHEKEFGINYLMAYMSLYYKVVSNYEVLFQEENTALFLHEYQQLLTLNFQTLLKLLNDFAQKQ